MYTPDQLTALADRIGLTIDSALEFRRMRRRMRNVELPVDELHISDMFETRLTVRDQPAVLEFFRLFGTASSARMSILESLAFESFLRHMREWGRRAQPSDLVGNHLAYETSVLRRTDYVLPADVNTVLVYMLYSEDRRLIRQAREFTLAQSKHLGRSLDLVLLS